MSEQAIVFGRVDRSFVGWLLTWSVNLLTAVGVFSFDQPLVETPESLQPLAGLVFGGLAAVWVAAGTWAVLIDLPRASDPSRQRLRPRIAIAAFAVVTACVCAALARKSLHVVGSTMLIAVVAVSGPLMIWQWTGCRIRCVGTKESSKTSIRQILWVTASVAVVIALLKLADQADPISRSLLSVVVSTTIVWMLLLLTLLGRWFSLGLLTLPLLLIQWIVLTSLINVRDPGSDFEQSFLTGFIVGFYFFSLQFLSLMRSSGHRYDLAGVQIST